MEKEITKDIVVMYHGNCPDGFTAAWAAWKKFGDDAEYIPVIWTNQSEQVPPIKNKDIYFLDYCPVQEKMDQLVKQNKSVCVIDHHVSREAVSKNLSGSVYDISHSGAVLAWKYFHPDKPIPRICLYVEDGDLWSWKIPNSDKILSYIDSKSGYDFKIWDSIVSDLENDSKRNKYIENGAVVLEYENKLVDIIINDQSQLVNFEGYEVYAVNGPRYFRSQIGCRLYEKKPPFGIVWNYTPTEISVSLRSKKGGFNLIPLAAKYGGGGHSSASNFRLSLDTPLPWKRIEKQS